MTDQPRGNRAHRNWLGPASLALAIAGSIMEAIAISLAAKSPEPATVLAWIVIVLLVISFVGGIVAIVTRNGRIPGIAAAIVSLLANPLVLVWLFGVLGGS